MEVFWTIFDVLTYSAFVAFLWMSLWMLLDWSWSLAGQNNKILFYVAFTAVAIAKVIVIAKDSVVV